MIVYPEHIEATCSGDTTVTMTSLPTPKKSPPPRDVGSHTYARCGVEYVNVISEAVTSPNLRLLSGPSTSQRPVEGDVIIQCEQTEWPGGGGRDKDRDPRRSVGFDDVANEVKLIRRVDHKMRNLSAIGPGIIDDCSKMVGELSRELALLHGLSQGIGVDTDCPKLRQQLQHSQRRACSLARRNSTSLLPLVKRKTSLSLEQVAKVEQLYRMYSGSVEYLLYLLRKVHFLLSQFHPNKETCFFIRTGIAEPAELCLKSAFSGHKAEETYQQRSEEDCARDGLHGLEKADFANMAGDIRSIQQLFSMVVNACDTPPWQVGEEEEGGGGGGRGGRGEGRREGRGGGGRRRREEEERASISNSSRRMSELVSPPSVCPLNDHPEE